MTRLPRMVIAGGAAAAGLLVGCGATASGSSVAVPRTAGQQVSAEACRVTGAWSADGAPTAAPAVRVCVLPWYPTSLRDAGQHGSAVLRLSVDSAGVPEPASVRVVRSTAPELAEAVRRSAPYLRFAGAAPGERRPVLVELPFTFELTRP